MIKLKDLDGVGKTRLEKLSRLGITGLGELLTHFPRSYEDRKVCRSLKEALDNPDEQYPVEVKVLGYDYIFNAGRKTLKVVVTDGFLRASLVCFNREYLKDALIEDEEYIIFAKFQYKYNELQSGSFEYVPKGQASDSLNFLRIVPVYPLTEGLTQSFMRKILFEALSSTTFEESLPHSVIDRHNLMSKAQSFRQIHFPDSHELLQKAIYRLKYYELFELEASVALKKHYFTHQNKKRYTDNPQGLVSQFISSLPFTLTPGQRQAIAGIKSDLFSKKPMHRLIQGDVGSGKTIVAAIAMLMAVESGYQSALMVPTEVLAKQHYLNLQNFLKPLSIQPELITGGMKASLKRNSL
ncbi:MAG: DEAD/DEAH box helicase, partial [Spirochaetota bacterium]|nr:DEAD/DEAH box helicase [Spirochaetota bacterium]